MSGTFLDEFWARVDVRGPDECWLWTGAKASHGYGAFGFGVRTSCIAAHRFSWELANARPVPPRMYVCHKCDVPACVNPAHLWIGTHRQNIRDAVAKGRFYRERHRPRPPVPPLSNLGVRIMEAAKRLGSLNQLCAKAGVAPTTVYRLLTPGASNMRMETLWKLEQAGVELPPMADLFKVAA